MSRSFKSLMEEVSQSWDADTKQLRDEAASYFEFQVAQQVALGVELVNLREGSHLTQKALEDLTGVQQAEISRIERGISNPTRDTLIKLATAFNLRIGFVPAVGVNTNVTSTATGEINALTA